MIMFWICVDNMCHRFTAKFGVAPSIITMSQYYYEQLFREMCGNQWWFLMKTNEVRGLKIVIDNKERLFTLHGGGHNLTATNLHESRWL